MDCGLIFGMGVEIRVGGSRDDLVYILLVACSLQLPVVLGSGASRRDEGWRRGGMINAHIWVSGGIATANTPCSGIAVSRYRNRTRTQLEFCHVLLTPKEKINRIPRLIQPHPAFYHISLIHIRLQPFL